MKKRSKKENYRRRKVKNEFYQMMTRRDLIKHCQAYAEALHALASVAVAKDGAGKAAL